MVLKTSSNLIGDGGLEGAGLWTRLCILSSQLYLLVDDEPAFCESASTLAANLSLKMIVHSHHHSKNLSGCQA